MEDQGNLPVVSTCGEIRRNTGRAYGGRARWTSSKKLLQSKLPVVSAMAAMPALPSTPGMTHGVMSTVTSNLPQREITRAVTNKRGTFF